MGFGDVLGKLAGAVNPVASVIGAAKDVVYAIRGKLPPEEQQQLNAQMAALELQALASQREYEYRLAGAWNEEQKDLRDLARVEAASQDPFVRRSRPAWLWGMLAIYMANYGLPAVLGSFRQLWPGIPPMTPAELPSELHALTAGIVLGISYLRSVDKSGGFGRGKKLA